jgi:putative phage-type endonuclease
MFIDLYRCGDDDDDEFSEEGSELSISDTSSDSFDSFSPPNELDLTNDDIEDLCEDARIVACDYIQEHVGKMSHPNFHDALRGYVFDQIRIAMFAACGEHVAVDGDTVRNFMLDIADKSIDFVFEEMYAVNHADFPPRRSDDWTDVELFPDTNGRISARVNELLNMQDQTEQRTPAWYERRHNLITASSAWKAFGTDAVVNQLIYEKCKPFSEVMEESSAQQMVNVDSPLHWGQKYEHLSAQLYQLKNNTRLGEFGCIQHACPHLSFLGGSPDGINIDISSPLFGRMVEIKNIVNREITGIPKEEYWIQMQIQMEVCDLDACDFVETRFKEYEYVEEYEQDVEIDYHYQYCKDEQRTGTEFDVYDDDLHRGIIIYFIDKNTQKPHYEYMPFHYKDLDTQDAWVVNTIFEKERTGQFAWIRNIYWKLDQYSCVLVKRNRVWFNTYAAPQLERVWRTIETERVSGYAHRAPKKRAATATSLLSSSSSSSSSFQTRLCRIIL